MYLRKVEEVDEATDDRVSGAGGAGAIVGRRRRGRRIRRRRHPPRLAVLVQVLLAILHGLRKGDGSAWWPTASLLTGELHTTDQSMKGYRHRAELPALLDTTGFCLARHHPALEAANQ